MRVYLLILGLFCFLTSSSFAANEEDTEYSEDVDESSEEDSNNGAGDEESEDSEEEGDQDNSQPYGMIPQSGFMQQQNMMFANQPYIDQNGMIYQNGMMNQDPNGFQNNMMPSNYQDPSGFQNNMNLYDQQNAQTTSSETKDRIRSIVNKLLGISGKIPQTQEQKDSNAVQNKELQNKLEKLREYMGEIIQESKENINDITQTPTKAEDSFLDKEVKNLIIKLQERVNGVIQRKIQKYMKEMIQSLYGIPLVKKSTVYKTVASKKSLKSKAKPAPKSPRWNKKSMKQSDRYDKKYSKSGYKKGYYTMKQLTTENDRQYVPKPFSASYNKTPITPVSSEKVGGYVIKSWGSQKPVVSPAAAATAISKNSSQGNYFSKKSSCGCSLF